MSICIKDQIQNMNLVIGCTVGCAYCYARNNVKRWHMIDDFADPEFFPGKLKMMEKKRPQNFLLTGMSDLSGWKPEWRDEVNFTGATAPRPCRGLRPKARMLWLLAKSFARCRTNIASNAKHPFLKII